jgi:hypothetical protein
LNRIDTSHYRRLKPFFSGQPHRLSAYSLPAILVWQNDAYAPHALVEGDTLVIGAEFNRPEDRDNRHLMLPMDRKGMHSPEQLRDLAHRLGYERYWFIPEDYITLWGRSGVDALFDIHEHNAYHDYVYRTADLIDLKGNRYAKKRNLINKFKREFGGNGRLTSQPISRANASECIAFIEQWCDDRSCQIEDEEGLDCEKQACINALSHIEELEMKGLALRLDGEVKAVAIGNALTTDMAVLHFEKADADIKGLYQYFDQLCTRALFPDRVYLNKESDMNLPGLAKAKKSYHPVDRVKSFQLHLK